MERHSPKKKWISNKNDFRDFCAKKNLCDSWFFGPSKSI